MLSLEHSIRASSRQIILHLSRTQPLNNTIDLLIAVPQPRFRIGIFRRQARDVAIPLLRLQARRSRDAGIGNHRLSAATNGCSVLLEHEAREILGYEGGDASAAVGGREWCRGPAVVLRVEERGFFALRIGDDLFYSLVAPLGRLPVRVAEGFMNLVHVEPVEEGLVVALIRSGGYGRHD